MGKERFLNRYRIKSARAVWHNYNAGNYFVTVCTNNREHSFGEIDNGIMKLSEIGKYLFENLLNINSHYPYTEIPLFVVMPNHIHAIVLIDDMHRRDVARNVSTNDESKNEKMVEIAKHQSLLCVTIRGIKSAVTKFANDNNIDFAWQLRFHDHVIRDQNEMNSIANYIENNPTKWKSDCYN